jgi:hypothetical protein
VRVRHVFADTVVDGVTPQMGHFYDNASVPTDPWMFERYYSDEGGHGLFGNVINIGTSDVDGRAFIVHSSNGTRIACGLLAKETENIFKSTAEELGTSQATAGVTFYAPGAAESAGVVYMMGMAMGLEPNLEGPPNGTDCTAPNGCGVHVHAGSNCFNFTTQGGHLYNNESLAVDPWQYVYYNNTDSEGTAHFAKTVDMGPATMIDGRAFLVHANNGSRVACGIISAKAPAPAPATSGTGAKQRHLGKTFAVAGALCLLWLG